MYRPGYSGYWVSVKTKVRVLCTFTGIPFNIVGLKTHLRAASTAAPRNSGWPLTVVASMTCPSSEIVTCTCTDPAACIFLALTGYSGAALTIALPRTTPSETFRVSGGGAVGAAGFGVGGGSAAGFGVGGGGASSYALRAFSVLPPGASGGSQS